MSRRLLATYVTLTIVVLAALEIPLGIQYGRSEKRDLTNGIKTDALVMANQTHPNAPRLYFIGYTNPVSGMFREFGITARRIARAVYGRGCR